MKRSRFFIGAAGVAFVAILAIFMLPSGDEYAFLDRYSPVRESHSNVPLGTMFKAYAKGTDLTTTTIAFRSSERDRVLASLRAKCGKDKGYSVSESSGFWFFKKDEEHGVLYSPSSPKGPAPGQSKITVFPSGCRVTIVRPATWLDRTLDFIKMRLGRL